MFFEICRAWDQNLRARGNIPVSFIVQRKLGENFNDCKLSFFTSGRESFSMLLKFSAYVIRFAINASRKATFFRQTLKRTLVSRKQVRPNLVENSLRGYRWDLRYVLLVSPLCKFSRWPFPLFWPTLFRRQAERSSRGASQRAENQTCKRADFWEIPGGK